MNFHEIVAPTEQIIEDARNGRMFILVDDEDREDEGDLVIPAQMATPDAINFMARFGRGLICLALSRERVEHLQLPLMAQNNASRLQTAFTVSIEAREGVTTGISASDRARTVAVAIDASKTAQDIVSPGHIFPLMARDGGVLVRTGHTEAAVDIARLAGLNPSGVICEIMNDDGTMARRDDLIAFAQLHGLHIGTIADLIAYRRRTENLVERRLETEFESRHGGKFKLIVYRNRIDRSEHLALVKGEIAGGPILVRVHLVDAAIDLLAAADPLASSRLVDALDLIAAEGRGIVVALMRDPAQSRVSDYLAARLGPAGSATTALRDYGVGAQILRDLGASELILLSNHKRTIVALEGYGLRVVDQRPIVPGEGQADKP